MENVSVQGNGNIVSEKVTPKNGELIEVLLFKGTTIGTGLASGERYNGKIVWIFAHRRLISDKWRYIGEEQWRD